MHIPVLTLSLYITKMLQTCLGTLGMPDQPIKKVSNNLQKTLFISMRKIINFITHPFLEILQGYGIFILITLGMAGH